MWQRPVRVWNLATSKELVYIEQGDDYDVTSVASSHAWRSMAILSQCGLLFL